MERGRLYRQVLSKGFAPNVDIHRKTPERVFVRPFFEYAGNFVGVYESPSSELALLDYPRGVIEWRGRADYGSLEFSYRLQQRVLPGTYFMEFSFILIDNFGSVLTARYEKDPGFLKWQPGGGCTFTAIAFQVSSGFFGPGGLDGMGAVGYHDEP